MKNNNKMAAAPFLSPIKKREKLFGILFIAVHSYLLPRFYALLFACFGNELYLDPSEFTLLCYATSFILVLIFMHGFLKKSFSDFFDSPLRNISIAALALAVYYAASILVTVIILLITPDVINPSTEDVMEIVHENSRLAFASAVLLAPIVEEAMFRGALFGAIRAKSRFLAYFVSMLLFAVYHLWSYFFTDFHWLDLLYILQYCPMGIILAWAYEKSGTIWTPIIIHAVVNAAAVNVQKMM